MADAIPNADAPERASQVSGQIAALTSRLAALEARLPQLKAEAVREALAGIVLQGGQNTMVSGGNGKWTIGFQMPPGTVSVLGQCVDGEIVITGNVTF